MQQLLLARIQREDRMEWGIGLYMEIQQTPQVKGSLKSHLMKNSEFQCLGTVGEVREVNRVMKAVSTRGYKT